MVLGVSVVLVDLVALVDKVVSVDSEEVSEEVLVVALVVP